MIEYIKENYLWIGTIAVPVVVAIIKLVAALLKKSGRNRNQNVGDINGDGNVVINGDMK